MNRRLDRSYTLSTRDVREAIIAWLKSKDLPAPSYVGNTPDTTWAFAADGGVSVEWTEQDEID